MTGTEDRARPPQVRLAAIGEAWELIREGADAWMLIAFLSLVAYGLSIWAGGGLAGTVRAPSLAAEPAAFLIYVVRRAVMIAATACLGAGQWRLALNALRRGAPRLRDVLPPPGVVGSVLAQSGLAFVLSFMLFFAAGFFGRLVSGLGVLRAEVVLRSCAWALLVFVHFRLLFVLPLMIDLRLSLTGAMRGSWEATRGHVLRLIGFSIALCGVVLAAVLLTCGLGVLVAIPLCHVTYAVLYRDLVPPHEGAPPPGPTLDVPLPPPSAYEPGRYAPPPA
jgi:hypothetical protein